MADCDIGVYGLAVMGQNLVLNIADNNFKVAIHNRTQSKTTEFKNLNADNQLIETSSTLEEFVNLIRKPRVILLIVKAGEATDAVIDQLKPYLEADDIIIDGGNAYFKDTERREEALARENIQFMGMGVSGGEEGARRGPSLMPGGPKDAYERVEPILKAIAAEVKGEPCVAHLGPRGAGHYVKMVHNGIEYAIMQAIAEIYDLMKRVAGLDAKAMSDIFKRWNEGLLASFLVEITGDILETSDQHTGAPLVDMILDKAKQKGTGKWTTQDALDLGVSVPTISAAVDARIISGLKKEREQAATVLTGPDYQYDGTPDNFVKLLEQALLATEICAYAQGFAALKDASEEYGYELNLATVASVWRAGCIIRADMLDQMCNAFEQNIGLLNLMMSPYFSRLLIDNQGAWREVIQIAVQSGIPVPALSSALAYFDGYRTARLPANLIQAQRDYFGAHTYERTDMDDVYHTEWQPK